jgi:serine/threonine protein kinase
MSPERLKKVEEIYHAVLELSPSNRAQFLADSCGEDVELRREVESLLSFEKSFDSVIDSSPKSLVTELFSEFEKSNLINQQINQYRIISLLGQGGMGAVYLAQDTKLERKVAIKFLSEKLSQDANRLRRFFQEAKSASALNHPNIITVFEIGDVNGKPFIVTEFIDGKTLSKHLVQEKPTLGSVLEIATQIVSALTSAHEAGIIHRDIKPDNVMIRRDGIVKVLDFGLAKISQDFTQVDTEAPTRAKKLTADGMVLGTPNYMSPEQARGQKVDRRTDIFSFGVLLYEMISGKQPFDGVNALDVIGSILKEEPPPLHESVPEISESLEQIVSKSLRKDREQRYQSIKELLTDLNDAKKTVELDLRPHQNTAFISPQNTAHTLSLATARRFSLIHVFGLLLVAALAFGAIWWFALRGTNQTSSPLNSEEIVNWTSSPGEVYSIGTFSPDGKVIAFTSTKGGSKNLWIKQTASGEPLQITKDEFKNEQPIFSPDGDEMAFFSTKGGGGGFWRIPNLGGSAKLISTVNEGGIRLRRWAKSNQIYYELKFELFALDANSGETKQVTNFVSKGINGNSLAISADEKNVAYLTMEGENNTLWLNNLEGNAPKKLFSGKNQMRNVVWHPDQKRLFYSAVVSGTFQIFVTDIYAAEPRQLSYSEQDAFVTDVSPDGTKILYGWAKEESDIWGFNLKENKEFTVASGIGSELWADVSPDGKALVYQSVKNLSQGNKLFNGSILTKTLGSNEQPIEIAKTGGLPKWSPDGKTIAFLQNDAGKFQIQTVKQLGGEQKPLTKEGVSPVSFSLLPYNRIQTNDFSWSPDSAKIAYTTKAIGNNIGLVNADGSNDVQLTENNDSKINLYCPLWSADGKQMAFTVKTQLGDGRANYGLSIIEVETKKKIDPILNETSFIRLIGWSSGGNELLLASADKSIYDLQPEVSLIKVEVETGKKQEIVKLKDVYVFNIHLSPDKKTIAFTAHREEKDNLWIMPATGGEAKQITVNNDSRLYFSSLAWSPDSNSIFFGKQLRYSLLSMLTDFK